MSGQRTTDGPRFPTRVWRGALSRTLRRRMRFLEGQARGIAYRLEGRHPRDDVTDDVLADRVRSTIGTVVKQLDVPHVKVMVVDGVVTLHGVVDWLGSAHIIEGAARSVPGVRAVVSRLHVGLPRCDTRPSIGRRRVPPSAARTALLAAAGRAGVPAELQASAVGTIIGAFVHELPRAARDQLLAHLPVDTLAFTLPVGRHTRRIDRFVGVVADALAVRALHIPALELTQEVLHTLRGLVPDEAADIAAVLPAEIRSLWTGAMEQVPAAGGMGQHRTP